MKVSGLVFDVACRYNYDLVHYSTNPETKMQALVSNIVIIQRLKGQLLVSNNYTNPKTKKAAICEQYSTNPETERKLLVSNKL